MLLTTAILAPLALPILVSAAPTGLTLQQPNDLLQQPQHHQHAAPIPELPEAITTWSIDFDEKRLVQVRPDEEPVWVTEFDKIQMKAKGVRFMDITDAQDLGSNHLVSTSYEYPSPGNHTKSIKKLYEHLDTDNMKAFLTKFSSFRTRYYRSETGKQSQKFLLDHIKKITGHHSGISISEYEHPWGQSSIIVKIAPESLVKGAPVTVIGAHQDSTNMWPFLPAPGADDDGSGTTSSLEALGALAAANFTPATPVEFHYYSAEEGGLLGSQAIAKTYEADNVKVKAMLQMDMTAWVKEGTTESVGVIQDFVDPALTEFIEELVNKYLDIPAVHTKCGYACSDHASFTKAGYQSTFTIESAFEDTNHKIHSSDDTIDHPEFSFNHMKEFSKLAVAFAVELAA